MEGRVHESNNIIPEEATSMKSSFLSCPQWKYFARVYLHSNITEHDNF
jgi:hypothetical protein